MRVTVKIGAVEVTVDRPGFMEPSTNKQLSMETTVLPTLKEATEKAKELFQLLPSDKQREYKPFDDFPAPPCLR